MRKRSLFRLAFIVGTWMIGNSVWAWDKPAQVEGVYQIGTASELEWFAEYVNSVTGNDDPDKDAKLTAQAVLTANIDMAGIDHSPNLMVSFTQSAI